MKEHPIIFQADMVKAILDGKKTMTRRTYGLEFINQDPDAWKFLRMEGDLGVFQQLRKSHTTKDVPHRSLPKQIGLQEPIQFYIKCPYGGVGDWLWVKETFIIESDMEYGYSQEELAQWAKDRTVKTEDGSCEWGGYHLIPHYRATEPEPNIVRDTQDDWDDTTKWSPSIHMPRWASRILLEITGLRAERLQDITVTDCVAEGIGMMTQFNEGIAPFKELWDSLNAKRGYGWDVNPWVWVVGFKGDEG